MRCTPCQPTLPLRLVFAATFVVATAASGAAYAGPDERAECANAADQAQSLRDEGKYRRAREQMLVCARDVCPGPIKNDCGKWLGEVDRDAPSVVFGARDSKGTDVFDVKVSMDGATIQEKLDGKPVLVDSGEHTFKFESKEGNVKEERVLLRAAEKARLITATFAPVAAATAKVGATPDADNGRSKDNGWIVPVAVAGGVGVVSLALFAGLGLSGQSKVDDLQKCKPNCAQDDVDSARTKLIVADVFLGVGVVALGVGAYLFFTRPKGETKAHARDERGLFRSLRLDAGRTAGGGYAGLGGKF